MKKITVVGVSLVILILGATIVDYRHTASSLIWESKGDQALATQLIFFCNRHDSRLPFSWVEFIEWEGSLPSEARSGWSLDQLNHFGALAWGRDIRGLRKTESIIIPLKDVDTGRAARIEKILLAAAGREDGH